MQFVGAGSKPVQLILEMFTPTHPYKYVIIKNTRLKTLYSTPFYNHLEFCLVCDFQRICMMQSQQNQFTRYLCQQQYKRSIDDNYY